MGKDENFSLNYILSQIPSFYEFEVKEILILKRMVGALVIRTKLREIMFFVGRDLGCDFNFEDIGVDDDMHSFHSEISRIIIEAYQGTAQAQCNDNK
jgi:predicted hydrocarbon binding protein